MDIRRPLLLTLIIKFFMPQHFLLEDT